MSRLLFIIFSIFVSPGGEHIGSGFYSGQELGRITHPMLCRNANIAWQLYHPGRSYTDGGGLFPYKQLAFRIQCYPT